MSSTGNVTRSNLARGGGSGLAVSGTREGGGRPPVWGVATEPGQLTYYQVRDVFGSLYARDNKMASGEFVFAYCCEADIDVKIFTTIDKKTGLARRASSDAIRIVVFDLRAKRKIKAWSFEMKRTRGVLSRLREKAGAALLRASVRPRCPVCRMDSLQIDEREDNQVWVCTNEPCKGHAPLGS